MPLFGSKKHNDSHHTTTEPTIHGRRTEDYAGGAPPIGSTAMPGGVAQDNRHGRDNQNQQYAAAPAGGGAGTGLTGRDAYDAPQQQGQSHGVGHRTEQGYQQLGQGQQGYGQTGQNASGIPPSTSLHGTQPERAPGSGGGKSLTGKIEHGMGAMLGSSSLKAKGLQKEAEAREVNIQGAELAEAERLEREAHIRRDRAVAHGAHPENRHLGAGVDSSRA